MKVSELIGYLKECPQDQEVIVYVDSHPHATYPIAGVGADDQEPGKTAVLADSSAKT